MILKSHQSVRRAANSLVEQLEQRRMLSSSVTSSLKPDTDPDFNILVVTGTKNKDYITVLDDPSNNSVIVFNDKNHNSHQDSGETKEYIDADLDGVFIDAQQGDDVVKYDLFSDLDDAQRSIQVDLSDGNDKFTFESVQSDLGFTPDILATPNISIFDHSSLNVEVDGQEKNDTIDIDLFDFSINQSSVSFNLDAGAGNDKVSLEAPFFGLIGSEDLGTDGSGGASDYTQLQVQVDLGSGNNLFADSFLTFIDYAQVTINVNGGSGKDTIQSGEGYDLGDDAAFFYTANLEGGNDYYNGDFTGSLIEDGCEVSYNLQGGDGNDRMTFEGGEGQANSGVARPDSPADDSTFEVGGIFQVNMYGGTGNDTMDMWNDESTIDSTAKPAAKPQAASNSSDPMNPLFIDTADEGDVRVVMSGDAGNDKVLMNLGATEGSTGDYDLSVLGAAGKDTVAAGFDDETLLLAQQVVRPDGPSVEPISSVTFGPSGVILVDGGRDTDTYQVVAFEDTNTWPSTLLTPFSVRSCEIASSSLLPELLF